MRRGKVGQVEAVLVRSVEEWSCETSRGGQGEVSPATLCQVTLWFGGARSGEAVLVR